jgi:hypothetical protein
METKTITEMIKGTRFYLIKGEEKYLRTITWVGEKLFEWNYGFSRVSQLRPNLDKKSKVKYILINN